MRKILLISIALTLSFSAFCQFDKYFLPKSLRIDLFQIGNSENSDFVIDELIEEPYWSGSHKSLVSPFDYGDYKFTISDKNDKQVIFSQGFSSLFGEWQTTDEAKIMKRCHSEVLVIPYPKENVWLRIYKRTKDGIWQEKLVHEINPEDYFIKKERTAEYPYFMVHKSGNIETSLDIVIIPEGYTKDEMEKFKSDCSKVSQSLFGYAPFSEFKDNINIYGVLAPSEESGSDVPGKRIWKKTVLNSNFYTFDIDRYLTTFDIKSVRNVASNVPYDVICIMTNSNIYGGGGIYQYYAIFTSDNPYLESVFVHEFGHSLAGLGDEYWTSDVAYDSFYNLEIEPWEQNITTLKNFDSKWKDMLPENTPIPTPDKLTDKYPVGVYEGGGYLSKGIYRPAFNCLMRSVQYHKFCPVCEKSIRNVIKSYLQ